MHFANMPLGLDNGGTAEVHHGDLLCVDHNSVPCSRVQYTAKRTPLEGASVGPWEECGVSGRRLGGADSRRRQREYTRALSMLPVLGFSGKGRSLGHEGGVRREMGWRREVGKGGLEAEAGRGGGERFLDCRLQTFTTFTLCARLRRGVAGRWRSTRRSPHTLAFIPVCCCTKPGAKAAAKVGCARAADSRDL